MLQVKRSNVKKRDKIKRLDSRSINFHFACVRGSPMVPLAENIFTICTNFITNDTNGKEIGANGKNGNAKCCQPMVLLGKPRTQAFVHLYVYRNCQFYFFIRTHVIYTVLLICLFGMLLLWRCVYKVRFKPSTEFL